MLWRLAPPPTVTVFICFGLSSKHHDHVLNMQVHRWKRGEEWIMTNPKSSKNQEKIQIGVNQILILSAFASTSSIIIFSSSNLSTTTSGRASLLSWLDPHSATMRSVKTIPKLIMTWSDRLRKTTHFISLVRIALRICISNGKPWLSFILHRASVNEECDRFTWIVSGWYVPLFWLSYLASLFNKCSLFFFELDVDAYLWPMAMATATAFLRRIQAKWQG